MRNSSFRTNIEFGAQIVIAIAVLVVAGIIVKRHIFPEQRTPFNRHSISAGERLNLADVDWKQNKKTLVFFLNKDCRYCTSSAPVYRQLTEEAFKQNVKSLAVFPHSAEEAKAYLESIKLSIDEILISPLPPYKIAGTPTVLFVNNSGTVEGVWVGDASRREKQIREEFLTLAEKPVD
jgi:thioredoxin-related protein